MKRGEIWTASGPGFVGKPRPVVIIQDDRFHATASVTVVAFTTHDVQSPVLRLPVEPDSTNALSSSSRLMVDNVTTIPRASVGRQIGRLSEDNLVLLTRSLIVFFGMAG